jgi:ABC-type sugar transport system permease subunit
VPGGRPVTGVYLMLNYSLQQRQTIKTAYLFLFPTILVMLGVILYPFLTAVWMSFTSQNLGSRQAAFVGFANYKTLIASGEFRRAFGNSFSYTVISVLIKFIAGIVTALVLNAEFRFKGTVRVLVILPWAVSPYIAALTWRWVFSDYNGFANILLMKMKLIQDPVSWLSDPALAMFCIIVATVWQGYPFYTLMLLAGLMTIPQELYEAVDVDGGNAVQKFLYITLPSLYNVIVTTTLLSFIWTFNQFQYVYTMTGGGPGSLTHIISTLTFKYGIEMRNISLASAVSMTALPVFIVLSIYLTGSMLGKKAGSK